MWIRILFAALVLALSPGALSTAQVTSTSIVGWYNGDWQASGFANWYVSDTHIARIYEDFVVPEPGWTVVSVFSNNSINEGVPQVTQASWEIRSGLSAGNPGKLIASGLSDATQTNVRDAHDVRIQVDGLNVQLTPGRYWLSVTPVTGDATMYVHGTLGLNAIGEPQGNNGGAFFSNTRTGDYFTPIEIFGRSPTDFSLGVIVLPPPVTPSAAWQSDIAFIGQQMMRLYSLPFPGISLNDFNIKAADLSARVPRLSDAEIRTGLQALVASIEDPHTDVGWPSPSPFGFLPLTFYWFDDGMYITAAAPVYQDLLGGKVVAVGNVGIEDATQRLTTLVPHENDQWTKYEIPRNKLNNTDFLFGTRVIESTDIARLQVQTRGGDLISADVQAMTQSPRQFPVYQGDLPLYRQHTDRYYWATVIDNGATVYFQYNSCQEDPKQASADFFAQLDQMLAQDGVQRVILDMRNNTGGFVAILNPWIDKIKASQFNRSGALYVIVGRATFSAAMYASDRLRQETNAIFVGEPTGGKPRFMNRKGDFTLPYFGIKVSYSNGVMNATDYGPTLMPDIQTGVTFQDYMSGADPALDAILSLPLPGK